MRPLRLAPALLLTALAPLALGQALTADQKTEVLDAINRNLTRTAFVPGVDFKDWEGHIEKQQATLDKAEDVNTFSRAINSALRSFGFSHIRLLTPRSTRNRASTTRTGAGVSVTRANSEWRVRSIADQSPAKIAGIKVGDIILTVDGKPFENPNQLGGDEGEERKVAIRTSEGEEKELTLLIKPYSIVRKETLRWADEETAVIRVYTFGRGYSRQTVEQHFDEAAGAERIILDLRSNGGGSTGNLNHLLAMMMPARTEIGYFVSRRTWDRYKKADPDAEDDVVTIAKWSNTPTLVRRLEDREYFKGKIAVLMNRRSASASEIVAAALKEQREAVLVGDRTAGAVLASIFRPLPHGFSIQIPVSDYVTIKGRRLEKNPLQPDAQVTNRAGDGEEDPAVAKAMEMLSGQNLIE